MLLESCKRSYPDFYAFCEGNMRHMRRFSHLKVGSDNKVEVETVDNEPALLLEGKLTRWSDIRNRVFKGVPSKSLPHGWRYVEAGIQEHDLIHWGKLRTCWKDKTPPHKGRFFFEIVSASLTTGFFSGCSRHCFVRLIDDEANVISVGLCGKNYRLWNFPLRAQKGRLVSPDPGENATGLKVSTRIEIDEQKYKAVKDRIEADQRSGLVFHRQHRNCAKYACDLLNMVRPDADFDNSEYLTQALFRGAVTKSGISRLPRCVLIAIHYIVQFFRLIFFIFLNCLLLALGSRYVDKDAKFKEHEFFKWRVSNLKFATGWKVTEWQRYVEKSRREYFAKFPDRKAQEEFSYLPSVARSKNLAMIV